MTTKEKILTGMGICFFIAFCMFVFGIGPKGM
jgi:hypothetical protein